MEQTINTDKLAEIVARFKETNVLNGQIIIGSVVAIGVAKMTFGGLGNNPFNPALVGRVFMLISFPVQMTSWG